MGGQTHSALICKHVAIGGDLSQNPGCHFVSYPCQKT